MGFGYVMINITLWDQGHSGLQNKALFQKKERKKEQKSSISCFPSSAISFDLHVNPFQKKLN
jgi:hypothetical protein